MKSNKALVVVDEHPITERDFMDSIDNVLVHLNDTGDVNAVTSVLIGLDGIDNVSGHAKSKLLWGTNEWWRENRKGEDFFDHVESTTGTKKITTKRYISVWKYVSDYTIPKEVAERPMRDLVPIANTLEQGFEIGKAEWRKINLAANDGELREILREIKGKPAKSNARVLKIDRKGTINLWVGNEKKFIGYLNFEEGMVDDDIQKAINKIIAGASIVEE